MHAIDFYHPDYDRRIPWPQRTDVFEHDGRRMTLAEWADANSMPFQSLAHRVHLHRLSIARAMNLPEPQPEIEPDDEDRTPIRRTSAITFNGRTQTIGQWSIETGLSTSTIRNRLVTLEWSVERTLTTSVSADNRYTDRRAKAAARRARVASDALPGGGEELSAVIGDRRGMVRATSSEIGVFA